MYETTCPKSVAPPADKTLFRARCTVWKEERNFSFPIRFRRSFAREREREREPIPVRGNKLRDDKPFSMDDEATEERRWFLNL